MPIEINVNPVPSRRPFELSGRMVLAAMLGFFIIVAGVNAIMMTVAIRTMPGVDVKSAYESSQHYNAEIARMHAQSERGWQAQARIDRSGDGARIELVLRDHAGLPVRGLDVEARLQHPASRPLDRQVSLSEAGAGQYVADLASVHAGGWTLAVEARRGDETVFVSRSRIMLAQ